MLHIAVLLLSCAVTTGCIRENLVDCDNGSGLGTDEYGLCFELALENFDGTATRAYENGDEIENYVNSRNMRVLFFDTDDNYICDLLTDTEACTVFDVSDGNVRRWYVGITLSKLGDFEDDLRELISTHGFKIAVFANWDKRSETTPDYKFDDSSTKGTLGYIAHCIPDQTYSSLVSDEDVEHEAYTHIVKDGNMGAWYDWVENHFSNKYEVDRLIRGGGEMKTSGNADALGGTGLDQGEDWEYLDTSTPTAVDFDYDDSTGEFIGRKGVWYSRKERDGATYTYRDIWTVWDFGGKNDEPELNRGAFADEWNQINSHLPEAFETNNKFNGLELVPIKSVYAGGAVTLNDSGILWDGRYEYKDKDDKLGCLGSTSLTTTKEYLHFRAATDGTLYIQATGNGSIGIQTRIMHESSDEDNNLNYRSVYRLDDAKPETDINGNIVGGGITIDVTDGPDDIWIFALGGNVTITEMEFIKDRYLFDTDRIGKQPDKEKQLGIPMYGIQEFGPVGEYWLPGEYFNVSRDSYNAARKEGYQYRPIWMLRSVAKIELRVSKALGGAHRSVKPSSVYMRSMNRSSRYEPKDFSTPTNLIWYGSEYYKDEKDYQYENEKYSGIVGIDYEVKNIKGHGVIYDPNAENDNGISYRKFTSWYYGIWEDLIDWDWNGQQDINPSADDKNPYPRVFNDRIARSDYARFIYGGEEKGYWYYYLYMPEKNIDDADNTGDRSVRPKVAHIELRFEDTESGEVFNNDDNLDDNHAYRIYFTDNGRFGSGVGRDQYDRNGKERYQWDQQTTAFYEDYVVGLKEHWPVVRNTIYRFTLNGLNSTDITVEVCGAASREVDIPKFD